VERHSGEIKRRKRAVGIFPGEAVIYRLVGALLPEQNDEWRVVSRRYMRAESLKPICDDPLRPRNCRRLHE
jgi:transposase-like protein